MPRSATLLSRCRTFSIETNRELVSQSTAHQVALERLFRTIGQLSQLPVIAERILSLSSDRHATTHDIVEIIQTDPALTASTLRRINSTYFGLSRKINSLPMAVTLLGFREIRNIALTVFMARFFDQPAVYGTYNRETLWHHCCAVAITARKLARVTGAAPQAEAYVAGLLHHVGTILIEQHLRGHFCQVLDLVGTHQPTHVVEREVLSFDQSQLSEYIARQWNFPEPICAALRYYAFPEAYSGPHEKLVYVVSVANYLCSRAGLPSLGVHNVASPSDRAYASLGLDRVALAIIWDEIQANVLDAAAL